MDYKDIGWTDCPTGSEGELMLFSLDRVHRQFAWKSGGLTAEQLHQQHRPSELTLAWLIRHLIGVETDWTARAEGHPERRTPDVDWDTVSQRPDELYALWYRTIACTRRSWTRLIDEGLDSTVTWDGDYVVNRRRALTDILEENLLHTGQASIIREAIDGLVGNDPP